MCHFLRDFGHEKRIKKDFQIPAVLQILYRLQNSSHCFKSRAILLSLLTRARIGALITPTMSSPAVRAAQAALASVDLSNYDPEQSKLMDERCILVDEEDNAIGAMDKKTCKVYFNHFKKNGIFTLSS